MKKILLSIIFFSAVASSFGQLITPFTIRKQVTQKGGIVFVSNASITCNSVSGTGFATCVAGRAEIPPAGTAIDNNYAAAYIDIDADGTTFMSSSDSLALASCSQIS